MFKNIRITNLLCSSSYGKISIDFLVLSKILLIQSQCHSASAWPQPTTYQISIHKYFFHCLWDPITAYNIKNVGYFEFASHPAKYIIPWRRFLLRTLRKIHVLHDTDPRQYWRRDEPVLRHWNTDPRQHGAMEKNLHPSTSYADKWRGHSNNNMCGNSL